MYFFLRLEIYFVNRILVLKIYFSKNFLMIFLIYILYLKYIFIIFLPALEFENKTFENLASFRSFTRACLLSEMVKKRGKKEKIFRKKMGERE